MGVYVLSDSFFLSALPEQDLPVRFDCGLGREDFISISDELALKYAKKFWLRMIMRTGDYNRKR